MEEGTREDETKNTPEHLNQTLHSQHPRHSKHPKVGSCCFSTVYPTVTHQDRALPYCIHPYNLPSSIYLTYRDGGFLISYQNVPTLLLGL